MCNVGESHFSDAVNGSSPERQGADSIVTRTSMINTVALIVGLTLVGLLHLAIILAVTRVLYRWVINLSSSSSSLSLSFLPRDALHCSAKRGLAITCRLSVYPSVTLVDHDHIGWKSWKLIARSISSTSSQFVAQRSSTYSQGNMLEHQSGNVFETR